MFGVKVRGALRRQARQHQPVEAEAALLDERQHAAHLLHHLRFQHGVCPVSNELKKHVAVTRCDKH